MLINPEIIDKMKASSDREFCSLFLNNHPMFEAGTQKACSNLMLVLRDARQDTGRNPLTGEKIENADSTYGHWPGYLTYLVLLEMIGYIFASTNNNKDGGILSALEEFYHRKPLTEYEKNTIISLRHSFAHKFSVVHIATKKGKEKKHRIFTLYSHPDDSLLISPSEPNDSQFWDGKFEDFENIKLSIQKRTRVNLWQLGEVVENVIKNVRELEQDNSLFLRVPLIEFKYRFTTIID